MDWVQRVINVAKARNPNSNIWLEERRLWKPKPLQNQRQISVPCTQSQSTFMSLPLEIRFMIYKGIFSDRVFHLYPTRGDTPGKGVFRHHTCHLSHELIDQSDNPGDVLRSCMPREELDFGSYFWPYPGVDMFTLSHPDWKSRADIGVLKTCRQAYLEGIRQFYRWNTFDFASPTAFDWFISTLDQQCIASISKLQIRLDLDWRITDASWIAMWNDIAMKMTGLVELSIFIQYTFRYERAKKSNRLELKRIKELTSKNLPEKLSKICTIKYAIDDDEAGNSE